MDRLECSCGCIALRIFEASTQPVPLRHIITEVPCKRYCGFKASPPGDGRVTVEDCNECRQKRIIAGRLSCNCGRQWPIAAGAPSFANRVVQDLDAKLSRVVELDFRADPRWLPFVAANPGGTIFHHTGWLQALVAETHQECLTLACESVEGDLLALLPLVRTRGLPLAIGRHLTQSRLSCLPRTHLAGPLAIDRNAVTPVLEAAIRRAREDGVFLQIKSEFPDLHTTVSDLVCQEWRPTYVLELPPPHAELQPGDSRSHRHHIRGAVKKALGQGVTLRDADSEHDLSAWYHLYLRSMRRLSTPPRAYRFFQVLWDSLRPRGLFRLSVAERREGQQQRMLAGSIFLRDSKRVCYAFTACESKDFALHPQDLILWQAIQDAHRQGVRLFDLGEVPEEHLELIQFKVKWGAKPVPLYRYYYPAPPNEGESTSPLWGLGMDVARATWRHLPLRWTEWFGSQIYGRL